MIKIYTEIHQIQEKLEKLCYENKLKDYRIVLKLNNTINVYLLAYVQEKENSISDLFDSINIDFEEVDEQDTFTISLYFSSDSKIDIENSSKNLTQVLSKTEPPIETSLQNINIPTITFYSYKGGVGRSTTLASFAAYYAIHQKKRIAIIDCDFEAPGFTNFFIEDSSNPINSNGVIEYLLDTDFSEDSINIRNYLWEASKKFSGEGEIYVMPSGNLDDSVTLDDGLTNRDHYLFGLSRLDFSEKKSIRFQFEKLFAHISNEIKPDLILLDSRTGFNDIFGLTAFHLSDIVVGFFGNSTQSLPGLHFFIDSIVTRTNLVGVLANSIIPSIYKRTMSESFKDTVETYINSISYSKDDENLDMVVDIDTFTITRNEVLELIGAKAEDPYNFIDLIESRSFNDYNLLFDKLINLLSDFKDFQKPEDETLTIDTKLSNEYEIQNQSSFVENKEISELELKKKVLQDLEKNMPELYAENIDFDEEYHKNRYYYRKCMLDLFNLDKFLVLGNKGTGKTYIYRSLKHEQIVKELQIRANKSTTNYAFVHIIDESNSFFDTTKFDGDSISMSDDKFYERFWTVYIWNVLYRRFDKKSNLSLFSIDDDTQTTLYFKNYIESDNNMIIIESELKLLDSILDLELNKQVIIIFDELDKVVKPHKWSNRISPLINLCRKFKYRRIFPKLFLRSDLFDKLSNVNNILELRNKAINIEWTQEELFAYFFKLILSHSRDEFCTLMKKYNFYPSKQTNKILRHISENKFERNIDIDELKLCCATFFGQYADTGNTSRFGETYDWLFKNLKNANDTISLRPFIDLISEAMKNAKDDNLAKPILPQVYFTHGNARGKAVERHFLDLAKEKGNEDLSFILKYIREEASDNYKILEISRNDLVDLLGKIITKYETELTTKSKDDLIYLLIVNGIIRERIVRTGYKGSAQTNYQFALLYKYYLGLKSKPRKKYWK